MAWLTHQRPDAVAIPESLRQWHSNQGGTLVCTPPRAPGAGFPGPVVFISGDMFDLAQRLTLAGATVSLLNMANPHRPGGGFRTGRRAQEE